MSTTWYQVYDDSCGCYIEEVEVTKETEHYLITPRGRVKRSSKHVASFATVQEAVDYAKEKTRCGIERLKKRAEKRIQEWEDSLSVLESDWGA